MLMFAVPAIAQAQPPPSLLTDVELDLVEAHLAAVVARVLGVTCKHAEGARDPCGSGGVHNLVHVPAGRGGDQE